MLFQHIFKIIRFVIRVYGVLKRVGEAKLEHSEADHGGQTADQEKSKAIQDFFSKV